MTLDSRRIAHIAGLLLTLLASAFFVAFAWRSLMAHPPASLLRRPLPETIALAALAFACVLPLNAWAWRWLLGAMGVPLGRQRAVAIMGVAQMGKYLPGNVGQHLGRVALALREGMPKAPLVASLAVELALAVVAAAGTALVAFALAPGEGAALGADHRRTLVLAAVLAASGLLLGWLFARALPRWLHRRHAQAALRLPGATTLARALAVYVATLLLSGAALHAIGHVAVPGASVGIAFATGTFALAWVAGFVAPGAPAGLGVREGVLALLLAPAYGDGEALRIVVALRIASTLGDFVAFVVALALYRRPERERQP